MSETVTKPTMKRDILINLVLSGLINVSGEKKDYILHINMEKDGSMSLHTIGPGYSCRDKLTDSLNQKYMINYLLDFERVYLWGSTIDRVEIMGC